MKRLIQVICLLIIIIPGLYFGLSEGFRDDPNIMLLLAPIWGIFVIALGVFAFNALKTKI